MAVIVNRILGANGLHSMSVVADESGVEYVMRSGFDDPVLNPDRPKKFAGMFEEEYGREPSSPEDWMVCALFNIGMMDSIEGPVENSYKSLSAAVRGERREIDKAFKEEVKRQNDPIILSDDEISTEDTIEAVLDPENDEVVALILTPAGSGGKSDFLYYRVGGQWTNDPEIDISDEDNDYEVVDVSSDYVSAYDDGRKSRSDIIEPMTAAVSSCPRATQDIEFNLANRQKAIDGAGYGPMNPSRPNEAFWKEKADRWSTTIEEAKSSKCGNCAAFIITPSMRECIDQGLGQNADSWDVIEAGELGYCEAFDFKCAAERTCDAWIVGGPISEEK